jgi:hypothetical protein
MRIRSVVASSIAVARGWFVVAGKHVDRVAGLFGQHFEVGLPQIAAYEPQAGTERVAQQVQSAAQAGLGPFAADPQQASAAGVDLIDQRYR